MKTVQTTEYKIDVVESNYSLGIRGIACTLEIQDKEFKGISINCMNGYVSLDSMTTAKALRQALDDLITIAEPA